MIRHTCFKMKYAPIAFFMTVWACPAQAQTPSFVRQFSTPEIDRAAGVASDGSGIYVIGNRPGPQSGLGRAGVRKYDHNGGELWSQEFTAPAPGGTKLIGVAAGRV